MNARKKNISLKSVMVALAFVVIFCSVILSKVIEYEPSQIKAVGLLISALILWISNALPMSISTLLLMFSLPLLGLMEYNDVLNNFGIGTALFIMASSGITVAIIKSNIPYKITEKIFKKFGEHPAVLVFCLGLAVTVFSGFVSSLATCTLFTTLISSAFNSINIPKEKNSLAKALMLSVPVCAGIGGFISPAGTPANLLVMDWLKEKNKKQILLRIVFTVYLLILFRITVFRSHSYPTEMSVNLSLFTDLVATYHENGIWMVLYLVVGNIVWTMVFVGYFYQFVTIFGNYRNFRIRLSINDTATD
jgi:di/tricarboxylate transporter